MHGGDLEMKRDMDLCREIAYQVHLLRQGGLIEAEDGSDLQGLAYKPLRLAWHGHEFLDAARNDTIWRKAKVKVLGTVGGLAFDVLKPR
jgi:hypothetical protein